MANTLAPARPLTHVDDKRPIICVDFDGVLHSYKSGWQGAHVVADGPVPGAVEWLCEAVKHFRVNIYSSRSSQAGGVKAMQGALLNWLLDRKGREGADTYRELYWPLTKPAAFLTIDDRAVTFEGDFRMLDPLKLMDFKPWNKR